MEFSSPLAAMHHPQQFNSWASRRDLPASSAMYTQAPIFTVSSFNFKERSMKKAGQDYFNLRPHRGSSPTASLAADLSSNCHIDQRYAVAFLGSHLDPVLTRSVQPADSNASPGIVQQRPVSSARNRCVVAQCRPEFRWLTLGKDIW